MTGSLRRLTTKANIFAPSTKSIFFIRGNIEAEAPFPHLPLDKMPRVDPLRKRRYHIPLRIRQGFVCNGGGRYIFLLTQR